MIIIIYILAVAVMVIAAVSLRFVTSLTTKIRLR